MSQPSEEVTASGIIGIVILATLAAGTFCATIALISSGQQTKAINQQASEWAKKQEEFTYLDYCTTNLKDSRIYARCSFVSPGTNLSNRYFTIFFDEKFKVLSDDRSK